MPTLGQRTPITANQINYVPLHSCTGSLAQPPVWTDMVYKIPPDSSPRVPGLTKHKFPLWQRQGLGLPPSAGIPGNPAGTQTEDRAYPAIEACSRISQFVLCQQTAKVSRSQLKHRIPENAQRFKSKTNVTSTIRMVQPCKRVLKIYMRHTQCKESSN